MKHFTPFVLFATLTAAQTMPGIAAADAQQVAGDGRPGVPVSARTEPAALGAAADTGLWPVGDRAVVLVAEGEGGLSTYSIEGQRLQNHGQVQAGMVDVLRDGQSAPAAAFVYDGATSTLSPWRLLGANGEMEALEAEPIQVADELTGLCSYRSRLSGAWFLYGTTDEGLLHHWEVWSADGHWRNRLLRTIPAGKGAGFCAVDPGAGMLYLGDEELGIWRFGAEPEADTTRELVDLVAPRGALGEEIKGMAVYAAGDDLAYLLAADAGEGYVSVYALPDGEYAGAFTVDGLSEAEGMAALSTPEGGWLAVADEDASDGATEISLLPWTSVAASLDLAAAAETGARTTRPATVKATVETEVVASYGDAADDPAIWVHPDDPAKSLVFGTDKKAGLHVYNLAGESVQFFPHGRINNVDLRNGFTLDGAEVTLVTASNRTHSNISIYAIDPKTARVREIADGMQPTGLPDPYGMCMFTSVETGKFYVFVNGSGDGLTRQFVLTETSPGRVSARQVREIPVGGQAEGCVADDARGALFIAEEEFGLWKYAAEPDQGNERTLIDSVEGDHMVADVEGLSIWHGEGGTGFIVASNQGADNYLLYRLEGDHAYVGKFHVVADPAAGIDGVSETDGLDVTSAPLGADYPEGLLVLQDGRNIAPADRQNFKFVSWKAIREALQFE